jgi:hypothetical protein
MSAAALPRTLRVVIADETFTGRLNPDAPLTVAAFVKLLPYRQKLIHVRWSGEACWIPLGDFQLGVGFENHTSHPSAGDVLFYPGGYSEAELLISYGACSFASRMGPLAGNHFMTLVDGRERLHALGNRVLWEGAVDQCVMCTLTDANFLGCGCVLLEDCCATTSPSFCTEAALWNVRKRFGFVANSDEVLSSLQLAG